MISQILLAATTLLAVVNGAPTGDATAMHTFTTSSEYKGPVTGGNTPNDGAHYNYTSKALEAASNLRIALNGAGSAVTGAGLAWYNADFGAGTGGLGDPSSYTCYSGPMGNFPPISQWMNFNGAFDLNQRTSMAQEDTSPEQGAVRNAIVQVSADAKVDARLILAVIMQESTGNVHVGCTYSPGGEVHNCGLMQANTGSVSYDPNNMQGSITQMVRDGTQGTIGPDGKNYPGYVQWISQNDQTQYAGNTQGNPYAAARGYNSGSINFDNLSDGRGATNSYVSDIANRLRGWNGNGCGYACC